MQRYAEREKTVGAELRTELITHPAQDSTRLIQHAPYSTIVHVFVEYIDQFAKCVIW